MMVVGQDADLLSTQRVVEGFPAAVQVAPAKIVRKEGRLGSRDLELRVVGTTPAWFQLLGRPVLAGRVLTMARAFVYYARLIVVPVDLAPDYYLPGVEGLDALTAVCIAARPATRCCSCAGVA